MKIPLLVALVGTLGVSSWAQPTFNRAPSPVTDVTAVQIINQPQTTRQTFKLTLKNVRPSMMAYWLDPQNHQAPPELRASGQFPTDSPPLVGIIPTTEFKPETYHLPDGVQSVVAIDPQSSLLVFGTPDAISTFAQTVALLDKPLRQVEIEAQFVQIDRKDVTKLTPDVSPNLPVQRVTPAVSATLNLLRQNKQTKVLTAPRVTALNNLQASSDGSSAAPVQLEGGKNSHLRELSSKAALALSDHYLMQVTPTLQTNGTVTVAGHFEHSLQLKSSVNASEALTLQRWQPSATDVPINLHDGETVVLPGVQTPDDQETSPKTTIVFLTAHIIKSSIN